MNNTVSTTTSAAEPFVGEELLSVSIATFAIHFHFPSDILQIGGNFVLLRPSHLDCPFEPGHQKGDVQKLWPLIGHTVTTTNWGDTVELAFDDGAVIRILPCATGIRGTILGKFPKPGTLIVEDF